jgi:tetratricopeptide (TPR) repeat protein
MDSLKLVRTGLLGAFLYFCPAATLNDTPNLNDAHKDASRISVGVDGLSVDNRSTILNRNIALNSAVYNSAVYRSVIDDIGDPVRMKHASDTKRLDKLLKRKDDLCMIENLLLWEYALGYPYVADALNSWDDILIDARKHIKLNKPTKTSNAKPLYSKYSNRGDILKYAARTLHTIDSILVNKGFSYGDYNSLAFSCKDKKLNCVSYSMIYYSIGQKLGLDMESGFEMAFTKTPNHLVVRAVLPDSIFFHGKNYMNWESTSIHKNKFTTDNYYRISSKMDSSALAKGVYLKTLNARECESILFERVQSLVPDAMNYLEKNKGTRKNLHIFDSFDAKHADEKSYTRLLPENISAALKRFVKNPSSYDNAYTLQSSLDSKVISLDSLNVAAWCNRGIVRFLQDSIPLALEDITKASELDPSSPGPLFFKGMLLYYTGNRDDGLRNIKKSVDLDTTFDEYWRSTALFYAGTSYPSGIYWIKDYVNYHPTDTMMCDMHDFMVGFYIINGTRQDNINNGKKKENSKDNNYRFVPGSRY